MKTLYLPLVLVLSACAPSKTTPMLHSIRMHNDGSRVYDYRIEYGETVLPYGNRGASDFDGTYIYMAEMPLPAVAVAHWRTAPPPGGEVVTLEVPIRDRVTDEEWHGDLFSLEFLSTPTTLKVYVTNGSNGKLGHGKTQRLIYSSSADRMGGQ